MASLDAFRMWLVSAPIKSRAILTGSLILLSCFFIQGTFFIRANSQTYDEAMHLSTGYSYLAKRDFRLEPQNPPLMKELQALPLFLGYSLPFNPEPQYWRNRDEYLIGQDFLYKSRLSADRMLAVSRFVTLLFGGVLLLLTGWWAYRLWGGRAAILAMALASLEPNLVAHSSLVTTDVGMALFIFLTLYLLWEYLNNPNWWLLAAMGLSTGLALASKYSAIVLVPMIALIVLACAIGRNEHLLPLKERQNRAPHKILQGAVVISLVLFVGVLTLAPVYLFQGVQLWLNGLHQFLSLTKAGLLAFFLGEYSYQGWWSYFPIAFLMKTPVGTLALILASLGLYKRGSHLRPYDAIFLLLPVSFFFVVMTQANVAIGVRHILSVYPFLFVLASRLSTVRFRRSWFSHAFIGIPVLLTAISALRIAPHQLAYFNELVGGADQGYRYLTDSNLDWGQDLKGLKAYMEKENLPIIYLSYFGTAPPSYYGIRYQYVPGTWPLEWPPPTDKVPDTTSRKVLAISVYNLQDVSTAYYPLFRWLWARKPVAKIGYSIFVYDLTDDQEGLTNLQKTYVKAGITLLP
jgi:Dolichyl-phosphate-mannose-protein mannosyltransferase